MRYIDTHSHIYLEEFDTDRADVIERAKAAGISHILLPNIDSSTISRMLDVCANYTGYCYPMIGLHPTSVNSGYENELAIVEQQLNPPHPYIAIGEVGLDLYWDKTYLKDQIEVFDRQIQLALQYDLPLVIHSRDAFPQILETIQPCKHKEGLRGIFHSFTGSLEEAMQLIELEGFMLGINGVVTFKNASLSETLKHIPIERIVLETDAPYLTPVPNRGKRNESAYLQGTLIKVAEIYGMSPQEIADQTTANATKVFGILKNEGERF